MWESGFTDELCQIAEYLQKVAFPTRAYKEKVRGRVDYHFSPKAGDDRWDKFLRNVRSQDFVNLLARHPAADEVLAMHAQSLHDLSRGKTLGKVQSARLPGRSYEVKEMPSGEIGCTCGDWRFRGSIAPGYECKHIRAYRQGQARAS